VELRAAGRMVLEAMTRGLAELAKMLGFYAPEKRELTVKYAQMAQLEAMSDEELLAITSFDQ
jgi:hypothetical protein